MSDVRAVLAQARFASAMADAVTKNPRSNDLAHVYLEHVSRTLSATAEHMPNADFDESMQVQGQWPMADELAYTVVEGLLKIALCMPTMRSDMLTALNKLVNGLCSQLTSHGTDEQVLRLALRCVPQMHGVARAFQDVAFVWESSSVTSLSHALSRLVSGADMVARLDRLLVALPEQQEAALQCQAVAAQRSRGEASMDLALTARTELADVRDQLLEQYMVLGTPLSGQLIVWCGMSAIASILSQAAIGTGLAAAIPTDTPAYAFAWQQMVNGTLPKPLYVPAMARTTYTMVANACGAMEVGTPLHAELYMSEQLCTALKLQVLATATNTDDATFVLDTLCDVLSERAPMQDMAVQRTALESAAVLGMARPTLSLKLLYHIRRWVQESLPFTKESAAPGMPAKVEPLPVTALSPLTSVTALSMAACIRGSGQDEAAASTTYTMLNYVSREAEPASINATLAVITRLAHHLRTPSFTALVISLLLQRTEGHGHLPISILFSHLVLLAITAPRSSFVNVCTSLADAMRRALAAGDMPQFQSMQQVCLQLMRQLTPQAEALGRQADAVAKEPVAEAGAKTDGAPCLRKETVLPEMLALVIEAGMRTHGGRANASKAVQELTHVLAALVAHDDMHVHWKPSTELVYLFRSAWIVMALTAAAPQSALTAPMPHGDALNIIALKTPTLIPTSARNYLDDDIDTYTVMKHDTLGVTPESLRQALSPIIGARVLDPRALSLARLAFVYAVLQVEWRRAACGRPSMALCYFAHAGVAASSVLAPLRAVAERTFSAFLVHVAERTESHTADECLANEARNILVATCHLRTAVREEAHAYLERLVPAFPWLFARSDVVATMLELTSLVGRGCDCELTNAFLPQYTYMSTLAGISIDLSDQYAERRTLLDQVLGRVRDILARVQLDMPSELHGSLMRYLHDDASSDGLGATLAMDVARGHLHRVGTTHVRFDNAGTLAHALLVQGASHGITSSLSDAGAQALKAELKSALVAPPADADDMDSLVYRCAALIVQQAPQLDMDLVTFLVLVPMHACTKAALTSATRAWSWVLSERPEAMVAIVSAITDAWARSIHRRQGLYTTQLDTRAPLSRKTEMSALNRAEITLEAQRADELLSGHMLVLSLLSDCLEGARSSNAPLVTVLTRLVQHMADAAPLLSSHPLTRAPRLALVQLGLRVLSAASLDVYIESRLRDSVCRLALSWFAHPPVWSYGGNLRRGADELVRVRMVCTLLRAATLRADSLVAPATFSSTQRTVLHSALVLVPDCTLSRAIEHFQQFLHLLQVLYENEEARLLVWLHPTQSVKLPAAHATLADLHTAWRIDPRVAVHMGMRFHQPDMQAALTKLVCAEPHRVVHCAEALPFLLAPRQRDTRREPRQLVQQQQQQQQRGLKWLHTWACVPPVDAVEMLTPEGGGTSPLVLQYAMRTLEEHPVDLVFFYVPQLVQTLRDDTHGYVADFILKTSLISQLFCHQIIWNMKANMYKDDNCEVEDPIKPTLDAMVERIVAQLSGEARAYYEREFAFFNEVTSISGKLRPYIKRPKPEKKAKIDEEIAKIQLADGVYLPSNPDGTVIDIDRKSGRPLQSAAKAPFMATFKVRRPVTVRANDNDPLYEDVWQSAIFKVGDDCRQDALALQVMAQFKNIFTAIGLDVYLDPYRVTATSAGCGVIDVVPNATSRDEMGRAKINDLLHFFINRYGDEKSITFQKARLNFIQSMAAYSVVCHILQIRDRHNGNIMIDGHGHLVHIDFGFLFDIGPGGMRFEPYSFKLSHEMVAVMGGHDSPGFAMFEQLVVKAFLACRPFANEIVATCGLMLGTDLPSFKGKPTLDRLRERFKPDMTEHEAAAHAQWLVKDAYGNMRGTIYDLIQEKQNHIPYRR